jgi:hypothetical protein
MNTGLLGSFSTALVRIAFTPPIPLVNGPLTSVVNKETSSMDAQHVLGAIDQLLSLNGWVAALCPTLTRPFGQNKRDGA